MDGSASTHFLVRTSMAACRVCVRVGVIYARM